MMRLTGRVDRKSRVIASVTTAFVDHGSGEPLVALHGIPTSSALFVGLIPYLGGFRVLAPDLLGQGETQTPNVGKLGFAAYRGHLQAFLDEAKQFELFACQHDPRRRSGICRL